MYVKSNADNRTLLHKIIIHCKQAYDSFSCTLAFYWPDQDKSSANFLSVTVHRASSNACRYFHTTTVIYVFTELSKTSHQQSAMARLYIATLLFEVQNLSKYILSDSQLYFTRTRLPKQLVG